MAGLLPPAMAEGGLQPLPPLLRTLSDEVGVLTIDEGLELSRSLEEIGDLTGVRVIMVIVRTTAAEAIEDYGERLAERWGRERAIDVTRTIFVVLALDDREMQIMPGRALPPVERALADPEITSDVTLLLRTGQYFEALMRLSARLHAILRKSAPR